MKLSSWLRSWTGISGNQTARRGHRSGKPIGAQVAACEIAAAHPQVESLEPRVVLAAARDQDAQSCVVLTGDYAVTER